MVKHIEPHKCLVYVGNKIKHVSRSLYFFYPVLPDDDIAHYLGADILSREIDDIASEAEDNTPAVDLHIVSVSLMLNTGRSELKVFSNDNYVNFKSSLYLVVQYFRTRDRIERAVYAIKKAKIAKTAKRKLICFPEGDAKPLDISFSLNENNESVLSIEE